jgi:hypothetical protein
MTHWWDERAEKQKHFDLAHPDVDRDRRGAFHDAIGRYVQLLDLLVENRAVLARTSLTGVDDALAPYAKADEERWWREYRARRAAARVRDREQTRRRLANRVEVVDLWSVDRAALLRARHQAQKLGYGVRNIRSGEAGRYDAERIGLHAGRLFAIREAAYDSRRWKRIGARQVPVDGASYDLRRRSRMSPEHPGIIESWSEPLGWLRHED